MFNVKQSPRSGRGVQSRVPTTMSRLTKRFVATGAVITAALLGAATPSALADTSTLRLGCFVDSPAFDVVQEDLCEAQHPALKYTVRFEVMGRSAGGYSYNWRTPAGTTVAHGCTSSSDYCAITVSITGWHWWSRTVSVDVTELATGATKTVTAIAFGEPVCYASGRLYFC